MATERQIAANRLNGLKGGVKTPEGKAISRLNARKHGIFASALTEADAQELRGVLDELVEELEPVGIVEQLLLDKLAVTYLRMQRCVQAEALHYRKRWTSAWLQPGQFAHDETVVSIGLYDARLTKQFLRLLHEIEQRQKARRSADCLVAQPTKSVSLSNRPPAVKSSSAPVAQTLSAARSEQAAPAAQEMKNEPNSAEEAPGTEDRPRDSDSGDVRPVSSDQENGTAALTGITEGAKPWPER